MLWGVTGCSGTGASTVVSVWKELGAQTCSLDTTGHRLLEKKAVKTDLERKLGIGALSELSSEEIRAVLRERVFADEQLLDGLNTALHPRLKRWSSLAANILRNAEGVYVLDAALLFELGIDRHLDYTLTVADKLERVAKRLVARDGVSEKTALARWKHQMDIGEKCTRAHFVIENNTTEQELREKAAFFFEKVIKRMEDAQWHTEQERN